jgi:hypothetical protein
MKYAILLTLLLIAAQPVLLVEVAVDSPTQASILSYERTQGEDANRLSGEWILQLHDQSDRPLSQTYFSPLLILPSGEVSYVQRTTVPITAPPAATSIVVLNEDAVEMDRYPVIGFCGDNFCEEDEVCALDCDSEAQDAIAVLATEPISEQDALNVRTVAIISIIVLILVLIGVLVHINKKKNPPLTT